ncbi:MAG: hypothetical protein HQK71_00790 [Desulfamplus sp.]|nr:hypothetical protein [Desulfamplus sp.]
MVDSISGYTPINKSQSVSTNQTDNTENAELFKQLLGKAVQNSPQREDMQILTSKGLSEVGHSRGIDDINRLSEVSSIQNITLNSPMAEIENKTDELLEKLSLYSSRLEDPKISLKEMDSLLQEINTDAADLLQEAQEFGNTDQELMDIVRECAIAAHSEYIKFQRGDYVESFA